MKIPLIKMKKHIEFFLIAALILTACSPKFVPVHTNTEVVYRDTVIHHTDTIKIPLPVETVREVVPVLDTLNLATSLASASAWVDTTTRTLRGEIHNTKKDVAATVDREEKFHSRDSIVFREVPVPYDVEKIVYPKWLIIVSILGAIVLASEILRLFIK